MLRDDLRAIAHRAMALGPFPWLRHCLDGRHEVKEGIAFTAQDMPGPGFNFAAVVGPAPPPERVFALAAAFFAGRAGGYGILVEADAGHPVEAAMQARGWTVAEDEPALVLPVMPPLPATAPGLSIQRALDEAALREWTDVLAAAFGLPAETAAENLPTVSYAHDPDLALLLGHCEGRAVAAAMFYRVADLAGIAGVAVVPGYRGRGFGTAITRAAAGEGAVRGCRAAALRSGPLGLSLYRRMGFVHACNHRTYAAPQDKSGCRV